jgi:hypothetical protein
MGCQSHAEYPLVIPTHRQYRKTTHLLVAIARRDIDNPRLSKDSEAVSQPVRRTGCRVGPVLSEHETEIRPRPGWM